MNDTPSLTSYLVFNTVARRGNLSAAAKELYISQPAVSRSLQKLEDGLEVKLFVRGSRGVRLTEEGRLLYEHTKTAFDSLEQAEKSLKRISTLGLGTLRVGASTTLCNDLLTPKLKDFVKLSPNLKPVITLGHSEKIVEDVEAGVLDVGLISKPTSVHRLEYIELMRVTDTFVASPDYLEKMKKRGIRKDSKELFESSTLLLPEEGNYTRKHIDSILDFNEILPASITAISSPDLQKKFALSGVGISSAIKEFISKDLKEGSLVELPLSLGSTGRSVGLVFSKTTLQTKPLNSFLNVYKA